MDFKIQKQTTQTHGIKYRQNVVTSPAHIELWHRAALRLYLFCAWQLLLLAMNSFWTIYIDPWNCYNKFAYWLQFNEWVDAMSGVLQHLYERCEESAVAHSFILEHAHWHLQWRRFKGGLCLVTMGRLIVKLYPQDRLTENNLKSSCPHAALWRIMRTSSNGNIFRVTGPLCGEFTGHRWIPLTKANDVEL